MNVLFPGKILAPYVEAYFVWSNPGPASPGKPFPAVSSSYMKFSAAAAIISGQATRPTSAGLDPGNRTGLGVKLRPGAFPVLFGIPAHELTDRMIPLKDVLGNTANEWNECIASAQTPAAQVKRFEKIFAHFVQSQPNRHSLEPHAILWLRQLPTMQVSKLAESLGYSPRHFQRKLNEWVGFSPSLYKRISRFENALEAIQNMSRQGRVDWSALAIQCGYSDQAHFIRDFREFAGETPAAYLGTF